MAKIEREGGGSMVTLAVCPTKSGQLTAICWWGLGWQPCQCHEDSVWGRSKTAILWKRVVEGGEFNRRGKSTGDADERSLTVNFESWRTRAELVDLVVGSKEDGRQTMMVSSLWTERRPVQELVWGH
jgi:hypothetical protein